MTEDDLKLFLEENKADIQAQVRAKMIDGLLANYSWDISSAIAKVVSDFVAAEIVPEVRKYLVEQKGPIVQAAISGASELGDVLAKAIVTQVTKNITSDSYKTREVLKAIFA